MKKLLNQVWNCDRADIPNQVGFQLYVYMESGDAIFATVQKDETGLYVLMAENGKINIKAVRAWKAI